MKTSESFIYIIRKQWQWT